MLKRVAAVFLVVLSLSLQSCVSATSGLKSYVDAYDGYEFAYPNGWIKINVADGPDVVLHDFVEPSENVSVVISDVPDGKSLEDLGTPAEVGQRLAQGPNFEESDRQVELISADSREIESGTYYLLEYVVRLPEQTRHNLASVVVTRGKLYTFNASTLQNRWNKMSEKLRTVVRSFSVY